MLRLSVDASSKMLFDQAVFRTTTAKVNGMIKRGASVVMSVACAFCGSNAAACSFETETSIFVPSLEAWEQHPVPDQQGLEGAYWEKVPAPVVELVEITRGTEAPGASCNDAGTITLKVSLPPTSTYSIEEFGIYFRSKDEIFPDVPLVGGKSEDSSELFFAWLDGHPSQQKPLEIEVEVFFVTDGLNIGSSSFLVIRSD